ncbi:hypothetical protein LZK98_08190 [Sphingomonas cannabina]|uniref:hypothetical protein n=1 Tax=Sphingomonas cannabina TaxID=2899123 RepID=UPI001F170E07|nr:hypothetical protein [Sphingomonas cannabina]UIJ46908.1 hypothetical protein LZK98_08190 [Sphingomonas cannabina]
MMSPNQARVVDPILTGHVRGYTNAEFIGHLLFPTVDMPTRAAKRIEFDRASFRRRKTKRAPGATIGEIDFGYEGKPVALHQHALAAKTPIEHQEEAEKVPEIDLLRENVDVVLAVIGLEKEIAQAELARNAALYAASNKTALAAGDQWDNPDSDPGMLIGDAKEVIRARTGRRGNTLGLPGSVATKLKKHPKIVEQFKYTNSSTVTNEMLRAYFDVDTLAIGDAIYDDDNGPVDIWGRDVILAYVPPAGQRNMKLPGYGYTYQLRGHPFVEPAYYDNKVRSWLNNVFDEYSPELVGPDAGFLIQNAIAAPAP